MTASYRSFLHATTQQLRHWSVYAFFFKFCVDMIRSNGEKKLVYCCKVLKTGGRNKKLRVFHLSVMLSSESPSPKVYVLLESYTQLARTVGGIMSPKLTLDFTSCIGNEQSSSKDFWSLEKVPEVEMQLELHFFLLKISMFYIQDFLKPNKE